MFMSISWVLRRSTFNGESLREFLQALTRYSANDRDLPVNDPPLFTGCGLT